MPFSEDLKKEVRKKAAFQCCRCHQIGVQVHHIIPQKDGGSNDMDNAAPLCEKCHADFGGNPDKRKQIREMRDWWYERVEEMFNSKVDFSELLSKIDMMVSVVQQNRDELEQVKTVLKEYTSKLIDNITPESLQMTASGIVNAASKPFVDDSPFIAGSPCQMSGQTCPACGKGILDVDGWETGVVCNVCGVHIEPPRSKPSP